MLGEWAQFSSGPDPESRMNNKKEGRQPPGKGNGDGKPETAETATPSEGTAQGQQGKPELNVLGQYIKDLSFESPAAPGALQSPPKNPQLQVSVNVGASHKSGEAYEVTLNLEAHAKSDTGVIYNIELSYGGLFQLKHVPEAMLQPVLLIDCPTLLFPFLRRVIADVTRDGGFPPLMLDPIDFRRLYAQNAARAEGQPSN
jgi:preprotein translocase subunit SecB